SEAGLSRRPLLRASGLSGDWADSFRGRGTCQRAFRISTSSKRAPRRARRVEKYFDRVIHSPIEEPRAGQMTSGADYQTKERSAERISEIAVGQPTTSSTARERAPRSRRRLTIEAEHASERTLPASRDSRKRRAASASSPSSSIRPETRASRAESNQINVTSRP